jgi:hypothetical protein
VVEVWITLTLLGADMYAAAARSAGHWWGVSPFGSALPSAGLSRRHPDLIVLGLDRLPPSWDELRRAYRLAARTAHPDVQGGSQDAFVAVAAAFERLTAGTAG